MYNFLKECVKRYKVLNANIDNLPDFFPCTTIMLIPGVSGYSSYNGKRISDMRAIFNSYAIGNDYVSAYNAIQELKNKITQLDRELLKSLGYEIDIRIEPVKDLTYIQDNQKYYRFQWVTKVTYTEVIV